MGSGMPGLTLDQIPQLAWVAGPGGRVMACNRRWQTFTGCAIPEGADAAWAAWMDSFDPDEREGSICRWRAGIALAEPFEWDFRLKCAEEGGYHWHRCSAQPVFNDRNETALWIATAVDVDRLVAAEQALSNTESGFRSLFDNNPQPMWLFDMDTLSFLEVNEAAIENYGYTREEFLRLKVTDIRPPEEVSRFMANLGKEKRGLRRAGEWRHRRKDGSVMDVEVAAHQLDFDGHRAVLVLVSDISERKRLEEKFRQAQKMEAIGLLAGGVAHDFNNLLTVINGYADLLLDGRSAADADYAELREILKAGERAASLTAQLLAFSRQQILKPQILNLNAVVGNIQKLLERIIGEDVKLTSILAQDLPSISADPHQIGQVIMNLAVNARDAMPHGGQLTLETSSVHLDAAHLDGVHLDAAHPHDGTGTTPGDYVLLSITDTGHGMDANTRARIFDPFFTTKGQGRGTGLGLSTVYGIVKQTGGGINVLSEVGRGTTFRVYLPVSLAPSAVPAAAPAPVSRGAGTVLIVEDDEVVRKLAAGILETRGYRVLSAANANEAMQLAGGTARPDLLLSDLILPGISGAELFERLRLLHPQTQVIFMSGYTEHAAFEQGFIEKESHFLRKPFTANELAAKVQQALILREPPVK